MRMTGQVQPRASIRIHSIVKRLTWVRLSPTEQESQRTAKPTKKVWTEQAPAEGGKQLIIIIMFYFCIVTIRAEWVSFRLQTAGKYGPQASSATNLWDIDFAN